MSDSRQLMVDLASDLKTAEKTAAALRALADLYEKFGSTQAVARELRLIVDGDVDPEKTKKFVDCIRKDMFRLLVTVQIDWLESREARRANGN